MMFRRTKFRPQKFRTLVHGLAFSLLLGLFLPTVLCVGADGHVEVELSGHTGPAASVEMRQPAGQLTSFSHCSDDCGGCQDLAVFTGSLLSKKLNIDRGHSYPVMLVVESANNSFQAVSYHRISHTKVSTRALRRNDVLLI